MVSKANPQNKALTIEDLIAHKDSACSALSKSRMSAATAIGHVFFIWTNTQSGMAKKWVSDEIAAYEIMVEEHNAKLDARFKEAQDYMDGKLSADHEVNMPAETAEEKAAQEALKAKFKADNALSKEERRNLRYVSTKSRENSSEFAPLVRVMFNFCRADQKAQVSRNCSAMEWANARFADAANPSIDDIVKAFEEVGGFDAAIELQRSLKQDDSDEIAVRDINRTAIRAAAREQVRQMPVIAAFEMPITHTKDGFANILVRIDGPTVQVIAEAESSEVEIESTVNRIGSKQNIPADAGVELVGRVIECGNLVPAGQKIMAEDGKTAIGETQRMLTMRPGSDGQNELVVSANRVEAGPVLIVHPFEDKLLPLADQYAVLRGDDMVNLLKQVKDPAKRSLLTVAADLEPKRKDGKPATGPLSWAFTNYAVSEANEIRKREKKAPLEATKQIYWDSFSSVTNKPLDLDGFGPQLEGTITGADIAAILALFPKPGTVIKAGAEEDSKATNKVSKLPRNITLTFEADDLTVVFGDAAPLILDCKTGSKDIVEVTLRTQDLLALLTYLRDRDVQLCAIEPDDRGLVKFGWKDAFGRYAIHYPTCGTDGRLLPRRVARMRMVLPTLAQAAE